MSVLPTDGLTELARQMQANSREAWERFAKEFRQPAFAYFRAQGFEASTADDLVQEAFVEVFHSIGTLKKPGSLGAWFYTILRRVRDRQIAQSRENNTDLNQSVISLLINTSPAGRKAAADALLRMTPKQRDLLHLRYVLKLTNSEIAAMTGLSHKAVKVRAWKARHRIEDAGGAASFGKE